MVHGTKKIIVISIVLLSIFCGCDGTNDPVRPHPRKDIEILKPVAHKEYSPYNKIDLIIQYDVRTVPYIHFKCCKFSVNNGERWDYMDSLTRMDTVFRNDSNHDYAVFRWFPLGDSLFGKTAYVRVEKYNVPSVYDLIGPIHMSTVKNRQH